MSPSSAEVARTEFEARILVVDDEPDVALLVSETLREADPSWQIETESDPERALARVTGEPFDCLITDLVMPHVGGLSLAEKAKAANEDIALIAISGRGTLESSIEALRLGFTEYIEKPFDLEGLQRAVCRTLRRQVRDQRLKSRFAELAQTKARMEAEQAQTSQKLEIASHDLVRSNRRMARQMEDLATTADVARSLMGILELEDLLGLCAELVGDRVSCQTSTIALYEADDGAVGLMVRAHPDSEESPTLCWLRTPIRSGVICRAVQSRKTIHINDLADSVLVDLQEREFWQTGKLLVVPIPFQKNAVGAAVLHRPPEAPDFQAADVKRVTVLANVMAPAILSAKVHHRQRCQVYASLEMVAVANEDRFPYLRGHSARVLAYAQPLGQAVGLSQSETGALQIAARLHDIGYVVIPHTVINHSGPLSDDQWEVVRRHPAVGADFLKPLEFFGDVSDVIRAHHESYDGTGYPDQKAGEEIPLVARLLTVADAFDGMTSHRPFRGAISRDDALEQIRKLAGQQFDPHVVEALVGLPLETLDEIADSWR